MRLRIRGRVLLGAAVGLLGTAALAAPAGAAPIVGGQRVPVRAVTLTRAQTVQVHRELRAGTVARMHGVSTPCGSSRLACRSVVVTKSTSSRAPLASFYGQMGYSAGDLGRAYGLSGAAAGHGTVALIETGVYPTLESDVGIYRNFNRLRSCVGATGCLRVVNRDGGSALPKQPTDVDLSYANEEVAVETALDVDMASAACSACHIIVVDLPITDAFYPNSLAGANVQFRDFAAGVKTAIRLGANAVSLSYGLPATDYSDTGAPAAAFRKPGVAIYASSGDGGSDGDYASWPQNLPTVISAGGTSLYQSGTTWSQTAWQGAGSSCSTDLPHAVGAPSSVSAACYGHRASSDISTDADPFTGVSVYDSYAPASGQPYGFLMVGGTSASAPYLAGMNARAGVPKTTVGPNAVYHAKAGTVHDVVIGSNAPPNACPEESLKTCNAGKGWDGPTGVGSPFGLGAFLHTA